MHHSTALPGGGSGAGRLAGRRIVRQPLRARLGEAPDLAQFQAGLGEGRPEEVARPAPVVEAMRAIGREAASVRPSPVFLHDVDPEVARENERFNRAPTAGMFGEPWPLDGWPDVPTRVLVPRDDRLFPLAS